MNQIKLYKNYITEIVGDWHPDKLADRIAQLFIEAVHKVDQWPTTSAGIEVIVSNRHIHIAGEMAVSNLGEAKALFEHNVKEKFKNDVWGTVFEEHKKLPTFEKVKFTYDLVDQTKELRVRAQEIRYGDNEVVYSKTNLFHLLHTGKIKTELRKLGIFDFKLIAWIEDKDNYKAYNWKMSLPNVFDSDKIRDEIQDIFKQSNFNVLGQIMLFSNYPENFTYFKGWSIETDTGVTGRKLIIDSEGGFGTPHGGGTIQGKDQTKSAIMLLDSLEEVSITEVEGMDRFEFKEAVKVGIAWPGIKKGNELFAIVNGFPGKED